MPLSKFSLKQITKEQGTRPRDVEKTIHEPDFIPYACHYDAETLITKNGELMQTIKIVGFSFEMIDSDHVDLRETIREAVQAGPNSPSFAVWFHTIRRRKNLSPGGEYTEAFPRHLHDAWNRYNDWQHKYINELFITVIREGETSRINTPQRFLRGLAIERDVRAREENLQEMHRELQAATGRMLAKLEDYGARKLRIFQKNGVYYSELSRFLGKILKLHEEEVPVGDVDLSQQLATHKVSFGYDALEVRAPDDSRRYGAVLSVKEYHELSLVAIDQFLQLPEEFIVTQTMDFIEPIKALRTYKQQYHMTELSRDERLARLSGLEDIVQSMKGKPTDYCEHQVTIFLIADDLKHLTRYIENTVDVLSSLGIVVVREDLRLEEGYWSQLPGNFSFLKRLKPINTARIGGFANLSNYPAGKLSDNHWGPAVTVFHTAAQTPYFFNFHNGESGHTSIIGPFGSGKTVLLNFLLSESRKFNAKLFFFDYQRNSEVFLRALGGQYQSVSRNNPALTFNPLQMQDTPVNRNFLALWLEAVICEFDGTHLNPTQEGYISQAIDTLFQQPQEERHLAHLAHLLEREDPALSARLAPWLGQGPRAGIFDHAQDTLNFSGKPVFGFEMADIVEDWHSIPAVMLYLLHRVTMELDGTPTIIVLDEAWNLIDNPYFAPRIQSWLDAISKRNALVIFATESVENASRSAMSGEVFSKIATQIYLPNRHPDMAYRSVFGLQPNEFQLIGMMSSEYRHFMLKKGEESIVAQLDLAGLENALHVLSGNEQSRAVMEEVITAHGSAPEHWLQAYFERMNASHG